MSPGGIAVIAPVGGNVGERVIAYVDHICRLEETIAHHLPNGFAMTIGNRTETRQARRPVHLAGQPQHPQPAGRPPPRPYRAAKPERRLILPNRTNVGVRLIDISNSGSAVATKERP